MMRLSLCIILALFSSHSLAESSSKNNRGLSIGAGPSLVRFDSNLKITNKSSGSHLYIDTEGTLGLPKQDSAPLIFGSYRFANRHGIAASYFDIRRENILLDQELDLGDYTAYGDIRLQDTSDFYSLNYSYSLFEDERSFVLASFGIFGLDLGLGLEATGGIIDGDTVINQQSLNTNISVFAPLPLIGLDFWYAYTPKWGVGTKVSFISGSYNDLSATLLDTVVRARYTFSKHFDVLMGIKYFNAEVEVNNNRYLNELSYGLDGFFFGLNYRL